ncbi:16S rRNA (guanine(966)-N(2))-methyltransferase RsmD [Sporosarcina jiandibaonis]|uniref:16S rRNA (guanine(966)-N(2))-methyltransferase RsmD n=1 Tax=Sporosarcina jiandibaonis TaxID=2715535 RepID=UPI001557DCA5|nr:16S rRNA (guanine(966)-N(2))-methyltransferase RsmD [Sporosarcina jiandibaonis]
MRIIAGEKKGLRLKSLEGVHTRPTLDKVKESVFNMIGPYFNGGIVVELFGGSGALSLEALSRGAEKAYVFEKNKKACAVIRSNVEKCHYEKIVHIKQSDARNALKILQQYDEKIDILFIDPPYAQNEFYNLARTISDAGLLAESAVIVCEHDHKTELPETYGLFQKKKSSTYGNIAISIYEK